MTWNYRIVKTLAGHFALHEVYYNDAGEPAGMTEEPARFVASDEPDEGAASVIEAMEMALADARKHPVFIEPEKWAEFDAD